MNNRFKVVAMGRVGALAINRFINYHPQISLATYEHTTELFKSPTKNIAELLSDNNLQQSTRQGIHIHDAIIFDKKLRRNFIKMNNIKVDHILHLVRNPMAQTLSWINHINASAISGTGAWRKIPTSAKGFSEHYPAHFNTMKPGLQCKTLYKNFSKVKIFDFQSLSYSDINQTMADVYNFLGVDNSYRSDRFHKSQNNYTRVLLEKGIEFQLNNEVIAMMMAPADLYFHHEKNINPWITIHDTHDIFKLCPSLPKIDGDLMFLPKSVEAHNRLSLKTRTMLHEGIADILSEILPVWAKNAEGMAQQIETEKLRALSEEDCAFVTKMLNDDLGIFTRYHPEFKTLWGL
jgi:hypothetical protein